MAEKEKRINNIIISGIPEGDDSDEANLKDTVFEKCCSFEEKMRSDIYACKRIGKN